MTLFLVFIVVACVIGLFAWKLSEPTVSIKKTVEKKLDVNHDGVINKQDAVKAAENVKAEVGRAKRKYGGKVKKAAKNVK